MKPNIAFDIDGVVANFSGAFVPYAKKRYGLEFIEGDKFHWGVEPSITPLLFEKLIAWFIRDHSNKIKVKADGANLVDYVWEKTHKPITFITARHEMTCSATHHWIKSYFPDIDFIVVTVETMGEKIKYMDDFSCIAEDRRKTAVHLAENRKIIFMPIRKYNWPIQNISQYAMSGIIPLDNLSKVTGGSFDHLIFKK